MLAAAMGQVGSKETREPLQGAECFTNAVKAADHAYSKYYRADWYIGLHATVQANEVRSIEIQVGPYDGSAGGGITATYNCTTDQLTVVEYQR